MIYETERLVLKTLDESHGEVVLEYFLRNKEYFSNFEPEREAEFYTLEFQKKMLRDDDKYIRSKELMKLWIYSKGHEENIIGQIQFYNIVPYAFRGCHIGYRGDKNQCNKGFMTEAARKGIEIMFHQYHMHRIEAYVMKDNMASQSVLRKLNFQYEGISKEFLEINGVWEDHLHYALINDHLK